jgi:hypothetical protein
MKIRSVGVNNRRKEFVVRAGSRTLVYPYARLHARPTPRNRVAEVHVDKDLANEGFTYTLESGKEGTVHVEQVLEYNQDPRHLKQLLLYRLTLEARKRIESSALSKREIIRRRGTSATQFYRLLDQSNSRKSIGRMMALLHILDCEVDLVVRKKIARVMAAARPAPAMSARTRPSLPRRSPPV